LFGIDDEHQRRGADDHDRRNVRERIERHLVVDARIDHVVVGNDADRLAVGPRADDRLRTGDAAGAGHVFDHDRLADGLGQRRAHRTHDRVDAGAGPDRQDGPQWLVRRGAFRQDGKRAERDRRHDGHGGPVKKPGEQFISLRDCVFACDDVAETWTMRNDCSNGRGDLQPRQDFLGVLADASGWHTAVCRRASTQQHDVVAPPSSVCMETMPPLALR
jgi:hypothetical protein